jgi:hypothetical protein
VALRLLNQEDHQSAAFATERLFQSEKISISLVTAEEYDSEKATQVLFRALRDPEKLNDPICTSISDFRRMLTRDEKKLLADEYMSFERECSPSPDNLSNDEFDRLVEQVKKTPGETTGSITSISTLRRLVTFLASPPANLPADNGSIS